MFGEQPGQQAMPPPTSLHELPFIVQFSKLGKEALMQFAAPPEWLDMLLLNWQLRNAGEELSHQTPPPLTPAELPLIEQFAKVGEEEA
jgi:hypothetical protein